MSQLANKWIDIFRAGDYGAKGKFTAADLSQVAADYDPAKHESPAVIGHPQSNGPAWGWAKKLQVAGDVLQAQFDECDPTFEQMVQQGKFKKRSASFYKPGGGPTGKLYLRHVGFLGAQPPEVKGLKDVQFSEGQETAEVVFEEEGMADQQIDDQALSERMTAWFAKTFGPKPAATTTFSEEQLQAAIEAAVAPLRAKLETQTTSFAESQTAVQKAAVKSRAAEAISRLKQKGKWIPAFDKAGLVVVFEELAANDQVVEFGEGEGKKSLTPLDAFVSFMDQLPAIVPNAPVYTGQAVTPTGASKTPGVNDSQRAPADPNSSALDAKTREIMTAKNCDYGTALAQAAADNPQLTVPGGAATGAV